MVRAIRPSLPMRMNALGVNAAPAALSAVWAAPVLKPMRSPPPSAALALRNCRRERSTVMSGPFLGGVLDSLADPDVRTAATDVPRHCGVDIAVGWVGICGEQRRRGHDLAGLAIAALRHLQLDPGLLNLSAGGCGPNGLDRGDALAGDCRDRRDARAHRLAIDMDRASATQSEAATEFRAGHSEHIAQHPEHRRVVVDIDASSFAVDGQRLRHLSLLKLRPLMPVSWTRQHLSGAAPPRHKPRRWRRHARPAFRRAPAGSLRGPSRAAIPKPPPSRSSAQLRPGPCAGPPCRGPRPIRRLKHP